MLKVFILDITSSFIGGRGSPQKPKPQLPPTLPTAGPTPPIVTGKVKNKKRLGLDYIGICGAIRSCLSLELFPSFFPVSQWEA